MHRAKTGRDFVIPIYPYARPILERRLAALEDTSPDARVFPFVEPKKALEGACGRLKFPAFSPRALRRYFIRRSLRRGVDVGTVADWQGHQDGGALLLRVYRAEINRKHSLEMAKLLGDGAS